MTDFDPKTLEAAVERVKSLRDRKAATAREWLGDDISNSTEGKDVAAINTLLTAVALYQTTLAEVEEVLEPFAEAASETTPTMHDANDIWESSAAMALSVGGLRRAASLSTRLKTMGLTND